MGVNSLPKTVTRQRRGCDLNPGRSAPESSTLTTRPPSLPSVRGRRRQTSYHPPTKRRKCECSGSDVCSTVAAYGRLDQTVAWSAVGRFVVLRTALSNLTPA